MDAQRWQRIQSLFHTAVDLPPGERQQFLEASCDGDAALLDSVRRMLHEDARTSVLDAGVASVAPDIFAGAAGQVPEGTFGPYRLTRLLGEGGMGVVYLGERDDLGSVAAVKILRDAWLSPARRERFATEQRTLAQLNHPSIARLLDADTLADGTPWFVMDYVDGVSITEYCRARGSSIAERLRLMRQVCDAVQHAHAHLVVHRDLKPSNILVTRDGRVKLLDFGISKQLEALDTPADLTKTMFRLMTPAYAAPEQLRGEPVGIHTDIYSLGVVLYELLAGRMAFDLSNRTPGEAEAIVRDVEPERPSAVAARARQRHGASPRAWADLDVLCLTAMHKDPERRYTTVDALARDIDHFLDGEPLEARGDSLGYRAGKFVRRHWRSLTAAAAVVVLVVGLVTFYGLRLSAARNAALTEAARTQRIQRFMLSLFAGEQETSGPAESLRVVTIVDRGVQQAQSLDAEPLVQAELYRTLGGIYQNLGKLDQAEKLLQLSLDRRRTLLGEDHPEVAENLVALGQLRDAQARYDDAERLIRDGLEGSRRRLGSDHPSVPRAMTALGQVYENRGSYQEAAAILEEAVRLHDQARSEETDLVPALSALANTQFYLGHYDMSEAINHRVLEIERRLYGETHPLVADTIVNLGAIQFERGRYGEAERLQRQALEGIRSWYGPDHPRTASALTMVARAIVQQGERFGEAAEMLRQSLAIHERVHGPVHPRVASALNELGIVALRQKDPAEAERRFQRMLEVYRQVYNNKHYYIGIAYSNLAGVAFETGRFTRAEGLFRDALKMYAETIAPEHQLVGIARVRLGRAILAQKRYAEAEAESSAGYALLMKQSSPPPRWVTMAREDLATAYAALAQPDKAATYKALLEKK